MTAHAMQRDKDECFAVGMDHYVSKPIRTEHLFEILDGIAPSPDAHAAVETPVLEPTLTFEQRTIEAPAIVEDKTVFDRAEALEQCLGSEDMLGQLARVFLGNAEQMLAAIEEAVNVQDPAKLHRTAHTLKGAVGNLAAKKTYDAALRLEQMGRNKELSTAAAGLATLHETFAQLKRHLAQFETIAA
jgi:HPt (histidine-containing phosphotransfer) domain-containing protein